MPIYRIMNIDDYEAAYALWIKCGNGLNDKDDSREGIDKYLKRNPGTSFVAIIDEEVVGVILCMTEDAVSYSMPVYPLIADVWV